MQAISGFDAYMPAKMPLYRPEHLREPGAGLGCLQQVFLFSTDREPDVFVDLSSVYETKLAACMAHRSQFPRGRDSLQWLQSWDEERGKAVGAARAESFKRMMVW